MLASPRTPVSAAAAVARRRAAMPPAQPETTVEPVRAPTLPAEAPAARWTPAGVGLVALLVSFAALALVNAWVVDDAYITFRTIDNWTHGHGLTWNVHERVQVYTHPLWMLLVTAAYLVTGEFFVTAIVVSVLLSTAALVAALGAFDAATRAWRGCVLVTAAIAAKAVTDYSTSGLENPLSYLLAAGFLSLLFGAGPRVAPRRFLAMALLASLAFVNRMDTVLLYLPALAFAFVRCDAPRRRTLLLAAAGALPAVAWVLFALVYYGFAFPNTAYAKLGSNLGAGERLDRGLAYLANSFAWDTFAHLVAVLALVLALARRHAPAILAMAGVLLYHAYVVAAAGSATHMSGRFFALPLLAAMVVATALLRRPAHGALLCAAAVAQMALSPVSAVKFGTPLYRADAHAGSYSGIDSKWSAWSQGAGLLAVGSRREMLNHGWRHEGDLFRSDPARVHVGGAGGGFGIGYFGWAAGPEKIVIDYLALSDPLLARLPPRKPWTAHPGHYVRILPEGYVESVRTGTNAVRDPDLREYYGALLRITTGPVFTWERLRTIAAMNLGDYDHLVEAYDARDRRDLEAVLRTSIGPVR